MSFYPWGYDGEIVEQTDHETVWGSAVAFGWKWRRTWTGQRQWIRRGILACMAVLLVPLLLTILYLPSFVHPVSTLMIRDGVFFQGYERRWVPIEDVSPVLLASVMMSEDGQFCSHYGIDIGEIKAVIGDALAGNTLRGASTISMQTVKNLYLWPGRSILRKMLELPLAVYLDLVLSKRRIMEIYINIVEWGPQIYGIEAAAQHYFGRSAKNISRRQAALLAVTLPNPAQRDPTNPSAGMRRLASRVEARALRSGGYADCLN